MIENLTEATRLLEATQLMLLGKDNQPISDLYYALQIAIDFIDEQEERRKADRWRPISEPPKEHDYYLVTCEFGVASATDIALFYPDRNGEEQWSLNYVTAWKPLPEPYESETAK